MNCTDPSPSGSPSPSPSPSPSSTTCTTVDYAQHAASNSDVIVTGVAVFGFFLVLLLGIIAVKAIWR